MCYTANGNANSLANTGFVFDVEIITFDIPVSEKKIQSSSITLIKKNKIYRILT